jgi:excisionase family DNA binding protein
MVIATRGVSRVMDEILTVREVAEYLKLSRTTIWRWCNEGKLKAFKVGRGWRVHRSEVERITLDSRSRDEKRKNELA